MAYNISEVSGNFTGSGTAGVDEWDGTLDLSDPSATVISGDFDEVDVITGSNNGEAAGGYTFSALSTTAYGTLSYDTTDGTFTFTVDRAAVIASGADQTVSFVVSGTDGDGNTDVQDTVRITILVCVTQGTLIATPLGEVAVEDLRTGDAVATLDGRQAPLRWIGCREVPASRMAVEPDLHPVRISASALAAGVPSRDLLVSPHHHVLVGGWETEVLFGETEVLAPALGLLDMAGVERAAPKGGVTYYHLLFDAHQVILTNGAPTESFYPGPWSFGAIGARNAADLVSRVPQAKSPASYGPTARPTVKVWEARALARLRPGRARAA